MDREEMKKMLIDYMERGFLENIIALFRTDDSLYEFIPGMLSDERMRVRLGTAALVEELSNTDAAGIKAMLPGIAGLLKHENPNVRGDAAYVLGGIKDPDARPYLEAALEDEDESVRDVVRDALKKIKKQPLTQNERRRSAITTPIRNTIPVMPMRVRMK